MLVPPFHPQFISGSRPIRTENLISTIPRGSYSSTDQSPVPLNSEQLLEDTKNNVISTFYAAAATPSWKLDSMSTLWNNSHVSCFLLERFTFSRSQLPCNRGRDDRRILFLNYAIQDSSDQADGAAFWTIIIIRLLTPDLDRGLGSTLCRQRVRVSGV